MARWKPGTNPGRLKAVVYAVLVHLALIGVLVAGWRWSTQDGTAPEKVVQAVAIQEPAQPEAPAARKRPEADTDKKDDERARKAAEDKKQAAEAEKRRSAAVKKSSRSRKASPPRSANAARRGPRPRSRNTGS